MYSSRPTAKPLVPAALKQKKTISTYSKPAIGKDTNLSANTIDIDAAGDGVHKERTALHFRGLKLYESDIKLLKTSSWISEHLVAFYYAHLQHVRYMKAKELLFVAPSMTQKLLAMSATQLRAALRTLKIESKSFILLPFYSNTPAAAGYIHWSLLVMARPDRVIYYYDSLDGTNMKMAQNLFDNITAALAATDYKLVFGRCLQQAGNVDSGVHVMCMSDVVAEYAARCGFACSTLLISKDSVEQMRQNLLQLIKSLGGILSAARAAHSNNSLKPGPRFRYF